MPHEQPRRNATTPAPPGRPRPLARLAWLCLPALAAVAPSAPAAPDGAELYRQYCAACHGVAGTGGVGVPLALPDFLATVDDDYLRKTIRQGRPGRVMPAFRQFSGAEVEALVRHLRGRQKTSGQPAVKARPGNAARGAKLYAQHCASCHGKSGEGGHGTGVTFSRPRELPIMAPALNNPGFLVSASDDLIKTVLVRGRRGTPMRSFLEQGLTERDVDDVVAHVRSFQTKHAPQPASPPGQAPVIVRDSPYDLATTVENVKRAITNNNFFYGRVQPLEHGLVSADQTDPRQVIVYFCNLSFLNRALAVDPRIGLFLPCRVTIVERAGKVQVMSIDPVPLSRLFNNEELDGLCKQLREGYVAILDEATL